jgi:putative membrane protein
MRALAVLLAASCALAACSTNRMNDEVAPAGAMVADPNNPLMARGYSMMAASSDQFEIQSSQLALQASQNQAVRNFANLMIAHHQATTQTLSAAAASAGLPPPPPTLMPMHQQMLDQLRAAGTGMAFDQAYKQAQIMGHQQALELHTNYANGGDVPALRQAAASTAPIVQQHLAAAQNLNTDMGGMGMQPGQQPTYSAPVRRGERG